MTVSREQDKKELLALLEAQNNLKEFNKILFAFPDKGDFSRDLYPKQMEFFKAGAEFKERAFMAGNRTGKTYAVCVENVYHLLGDYPEWWEGRRFKNGIIAVVAGKTSAQTKMALQEKFIGPPEQEGKGLIPKDRIVKIIKKPGSGGAIDHVVVKHSSGENSYLYFMSYEQGREAFQGFEANIITFDEEPPLDVYSEGITRTAVLSREKGGGMILLSFTPLKGMSDVVMSFMPDGEIPKYQKHRFIIQAGWDDVPHISDEDKEALMSKYQPHELEARTKGIPALGAGTVYPFMDKDIVIPWFKLPEEWPRAYGFDYGHKRTAGIFAALDPNTDTIYIYDEYVREQAEYAAHADALRKKGAGWMWGASESSLISHNSGTKLIDIYREEFGLNLIPAKKDVELGIAKVSARFAAGTLKIFDTCETTIKERHLYHREERPDGSLKIKKKFDDIMDCLRYLIMEGPPIFTVDPDMENESFEDYYDGSKNPTTGY